MVAPAVLQDRVQQVLNGDGHLSSCYSLYQRIYNWLAGWCLTVVPVTKTVGVGHFRRYCNTGYDQSQGRRPSALKCTGPIFEGDMERNHLSEINPKPNSQYRGIGREATVAPDGRPVSRTETTLTSLPP